MEHQGYKRESGELILADMDRVRSWPGNNKRPVIPPSVKRAEITSAKI